jgi:hypothetical protein
MIEGVVFMDDNLLNRVSKIKKNIISHKRQNSEYPSLYESQLFLELLRNRRTNKRTCSEKNKQLIQLEVYRECRKKDSICSGASIKMSA